MERWESQWNESDVIPVNFQRTIAFESSGKPIRPCEFCRFLALVDDVLTLRPAYHSEKYLLQRNPSRKPVTIYVSLI